MFIFRFFTLVFTMWIFSCDHELKLPSDKEDITSKIIFDQKEIFDIGEVRKFNRQALERFVSQPIHQHNFNRKPNIYFFFVDTLRNDKLNPSDTPNLTELRKSSLAFANSYSSSTVTHSSTYGIFYANPVLYRDQVLLQEWDKGSPFLNALKQGGYKINLNGSPWQYCIDTNRFFNTKKELMAAAESNLQILYGLKTKNLVDFCYPNPGGPSLPQNEPKVRFIGIDENGKNIGHQGYRDHAVISDLLKVIEQRKPDAHGNFHLVYLSGVHDPYSWLEYGYPIENSGVLDPIENYYKIDKPFFPWNPNWNAYRPKNPTEEFKISIRNSYVNAVRAMDFEIGRVIKKLKDLQQFDNSLIVIVSDHGEFLHETDLFPGDNNNRIGHWVIPPQIKWLQK